MQLKNLDKMCGVKIKQQQADWQRRPESEVPVNNFLFSPVSPSLHSTKCETHKWALLWRQEDRTRRSLLIGLKGKQKMLPVSREHARNPPFLHFVTSQSPKISLGGDGFYSGSKWVPARA